jgi:hypothetical protein
VARSNADPSPCSSKGRFSAKGWWIRFPLGRRQQFRSRSSEASRLTKIAKRTKSAREWPKFRTALFTIERDRVLQTKYRVRNGGDTQAKLLVKHPRLVGARLFEPPKGTDDNVGTGSALVPVGDCRALDRGARRRRAGTGPRARRLVQRHCRRRGKGFHRGRQVDREVVRKLSGRGTLRRDIVRKRAERDKLEVETGKLAQGTEETRRNLRAIERNKTAEALRQKLTARLAEAAARLDELNRKTVELDSQLAELGVRWSEVLARHRARDPCGGGRVLRGGAGALFVGLVGATYAAVLLALVPGHQAAADSHYHFSVAREIAHGTLIPDVARGLPFTDFARHARGPLLGLSRSFGSVRAHLEPGDRLEGRDRIAFCAGMRGYLPFSEGAQSCLRLGLGPLTHALLHAGLALPPAARRAAHGAAPTRHDPGRVLRGTRFDSKDSRS